jgi:hypothetical protein
MEVMFVLRPDDRNRPVGGSTDPHLSALRYGQMEIDSMRGMRLECNLSVWPGEQSALIQACPQGGQRTPWM